MLSVAIPAYNAVTTLQECVESLLGQTRPPDEIVIADDGSTDGTRELIAGLKAKHDCILAILRDENLGVAANRDDALRRCAGPFISQLDADDCVDPRKFERELAIVQSDASAVAMSNFELVSLDMMRIVSRRSVDAYDRIDPAMRAERLLARRKTVPRDMTFAKRLYLKAGGYEPAIPLYEDWDFKLRLSAISGPWIATSGVGTRYRQGSPQSLSSKSADVHARWLARIALSRFNLVRTIVGDQAALGAFVEGLDMADYLRITSERLLPSTARRIRLALERDKDLSEMPLAQIDHRWNTERPGLSRLGKRIGEILVEDGLAAVKPAYLRPHVTKVGVMVRNLDRNLGRPAARTYNSLRNR